MSRRLRVPALAAALVLCCAAVLSAAGATLTGTHKDDTPDLILRYAENQPEGYPTTEAAYAFADPVAQRTDGRAIGLTGLAWFDAGLRHFYTNSPVTRLEDLEGMKIRVAESSLMEAIVLQLGADPVRIPYDDVYSALAKREIDGAENNWPSYDYTGHYEVAKYMLLDGHTRIPELMLASAEAMDKLADLDPEFPPPGAAVRQGGGPAGTEAVEADRSRLGRKDAQGGGHRDHSGRRGTGTVPPGHRPHLPHVRRPESPHPPHPERRRRPWVTTPPYPEYAPFSAPESPKSFPAPFCILHNPPPTGFGNLHKSHLQFFLENSTFFAPIAGVLKNG